MNKIVICDKCEGNGSFVQQASRRDEDDKDITCNKCNGTGRLRQFKIEISFPSDIPKHKIYVIDDKIHNFIKSL